MHALSRVKQRPQLRRVSLSRGLVWSAPDAHVWELLVPNDSGGVQSVPLTRTLVVSVALVSLCWVAALGVLGYGIGRWRYTRGATLTTSASAHGHAASFPTNSDEKVRDVNHEALRVGLGTLAAARKLLVGHVEPQWYALAPQTGHATLQWPVPNGWFVRGYGSGLDGYHMGVDIAGPRGSTIVAVDDAIVGYAGDEVRGMGNVVLLLHADGRTSLYAHNESNVVVSGQRVTRGQAIAKLGNTGISRGPHSHFEFGFSDRTCDPAPLFRPSIRHRNGHASELPKLEWPNGTRPPVLCGRRRAHPHSRYTH